MVSDRSLRQSCTADSLVLAAAPSRATPSDAIDRAMSDVAASDGRSEQRIALREVRQTTRREDKSEPHAHCCPAAFAFTQSNTTQP